MNSSAKLQKVLDIVARLRDPESGCPWDRRQTFESIVPHTLEEAYEVADVIETGRLEELPDELGDLLFQVVFYARMAEEAGLFDFAAVATGLAEKLVRRHPHVFAGVEYASAEERGRAWELLKREERRHAGAHAGDSILAGIAGALPALTRAQKLQSRAARAGFDWTSAPPVFDKIEEELHELREAISMDAASRMLELELGDLLFACVNLARHLGLDAESALRASNRKFERRFAQVERRLREQGGDPESADLDEMDRLWNEAKAAE